MEGLTIIAENFRYVLDNYLLASGETFAEHQVADYIRNNLKIPFEEMVDDNKYKVFGSAGQGNWAIVPWLAIFNKEITTSAQDGYYIVYLFKENMDGFYLSLNFGATEFKNKYGKSNIVTAANNFRGLLEDFEEIQNYQPLDLGHREGKKKGSNSRDYELGDIFNIYYPKDYLPSDEKLIEDFNLLLRMYEHIYEKRGNIIFTDEELQNEDNASQFVSPTEPQEKTTMKFQEYLEKRNFFFDAKTIENYLLSLKVKPFIILTGNSGTGKTKLSQLFAEYLQTYEYSSKEGTEIKNSKEENPVEKEVENPNYHFVNVSTTLKSWGKAKDGVTDTTPGWTLSTHDFRDILPINQVEGEYEIEIDGYKSTANIYFLPKLNYKREFEDLRQHFKELYEQEQEQIEKDEEDGVKHNSQKVKLGINYDALEKAITRDYEQSDIISIQMNISDTILSGSRIDLPKSFLDYSPFKRSFPCNITSEGFDAEGTFEISLRIGNYKSNELMDYLGRLKANGIDSFELKIFGFKPNIDYFTPALNSYEIKDESGTVSDDIYAIVPVGSNWTENRNVVGYYNVLTKDYQHTQSLDLLLKAIGDSRSFFLILDEMNLSHVERYFSDFLSAMESGKAIPLHKASYEYKGEVPEELEIPENVFIIGTVNVDETTYMFSPKVLDRANVLEFKTFEELTISDYIRNTPPEVKFSGNVDYLVDVMSDESIREKIISLVNNEFKDVKFEIQTVIIENEGEENEQEKIEIKKVNVLDEIINALTKINEYLKGSGFEFGYRTVNEILAFMYVAWKYEGQKTEWNTWRRYLDAQILQKILPKLHGSQMSLGETLDNLLTYCLDIDSVDSAPELKDIDDTYPYPDSAKKLIQMKEVLEKQRYVSFIN